MTGIPFGKLKARNAAAGNGWTVVEHEEGLGGRSGHRATFVTRCELEALGEAKCRQSALCG
jgi:hypothetical protein